MELVKTALTTLGVALMDRDAYQRLVLSVRGSTKMELVLNVEITPELQMMVSPALRNNVTTDKGSSWTGRAATALPTIEPVTMGDSVFQTSVTLERSFCLTAPVNSAKILKGRKAMASPAVRITVPLGRN